MTTTGLDGIVIGYRRELSSALAAELRAAADSVEEFERISKSADPERVVKVKVVGAFASSLWACSVNTEKWASDEVLARHISNREPAA